MTSAGSVCACADLQSMQLCVERKEGCKAVEDSQGDLVVGIDSYAYYRGGQKKHENERDQIGDD